MTFTDRIPAVVPRIKPSGEPIHYPTCGRWDCDDGEDWEWIASTDENYPAVKREYQIATYHQPRNDWPRRLHEERNKLSDGDPLWWGREFPAFVRAEVESGGTRGARGVLDR